ncbi:hypothetical protein [Nostoc sp.]|uniref:hypothetical protein n=1 Tax=Nostoc sp. TaxID=1180 RepID=UPI002FF3B3E2
MLLIWGDRMMGYFFCISQIIYKGVGVARRRHRLVYCRVSAIAKTVYFLYISHTTLIRRSAKI